MPWKIYINAPIASLLMRYWNAAWQLHGRNIHGISFQADALNFFRHKVLTYEVAIKCRWTMEVGCSIEWQWVEVVQKWVKEKMTMSLLSQPTTPYTTMKRIQAKYALKQKLPNDLFISWQDSWIILAIRRVESKIKRLPRLKRARGTRGVKDQRVLAVHTPLNPPESLPWKNINTQDIFSV